MTAPTVVTVDVSLSPDSANPGGIYQFNPHVINVANGTVLSFRFSGIPGNHSVTQSSFATPCQPLAGGFDSGFIAGKETAEGVFPAWNFTVVNDQDPMWFYCKQQTPTPHCHQGMVGMINGATYRFKSFQAKAQGVTLSSSSNNSTSATAPSASDSTSNDTFFGPPKGPLPVGAIVGITLGTLAFLGLLIFALLWWRRRLRRRAQFEQRMRPEPYRKLASDAENAAPETMSILSTILREVRGLRWQVRGGAASAGAGGASGVGVDSTRSTEPPPIYSV